MSQRPKFQYPKSAENKYRRQLNKLAVQVGDIINAHIAGGTVVDQDGMRRSIELYTQAITPWARAVGSDMVNSVDNTSENDWTALSKQVSDKMEFMVNNTDTGEIVQQLIDEQVELIQSIPQDAAIRAQKLALEGVVSGERADEIREMLLDTTNVTKSRAQTIARTETARANSAVTHARAYQTGVQEYKWVAVMDSRTRQSHEAMDGNTYRFDTPPLVEGEGYHGPGQIYNCRCYADPIIPMTLTQ